MNTTQFTLKFTLQNALVTGPISKGGEQRISPEPGHRPLPKIFDVNVSRMDPSNELYKCSHWAEGAKLIFRPFFMGVADSVGKFLTLLWEGVERQTRASNCSESSH